MSVFLSGVIGAAIAAAVWLGLEYTTQMDLGWLSCVVGVVTGYCVHRAAGPGSGGSFARGALSVVLALAAIVGGRQVYVKVMEANAVNAKVVFLTPEPETTDAPVITTEDSEVAPHQAPPAESDVPKDSEVAVASEPEATESTLEDTAEDVDVALPQAPPVVKKPTQVEPLAISRLKFKNTFSEWNTLWMCLAALAAYIIGKGRDEVIPQGDSD